MKILHLSQQTDKTFIFFEIFSLICQNFEIYLNKYVSFENFTLQHSEICFVILDFTKAAAGKVP